MFLVSLLMTFHQKNSKWDESITLSKQDKLYKDAMVTAATSASIEVAEDLLSYFVDIGNKECFAGMLYACFDLLRADVVEELSWQHGLNDFYMPYKIQRTRTLVDKVSSLIHPNILNILKLSFLVACILGEAGSGTVAKG